MLSVLQSYIQVFKVLYVHSANLLICEKAKFENKASIFFN